MNRPQMVGAHTFVVLGLVGIGEIGKAKAMFETLNKSGVIGLPEK